MKSHAFEFNKICNNRRANINSVRNHKISQNSICFGHKNVNWPDFVWIILQEIQLREFGLILFIFFQTFWDIVITLSNFYSRKNICKFEIRISVGIEFPKLLVKCMNPYLEYLETFPYRRQIHRRNQFHNVPGFWHAPLDRIVVSNSKLSKVLNH